MRKIIKSAIIKHFDEQKRNDLVNKMLNKKYFLK